MPINSSEDDCLVSDTNDKFIYCNFKPTASKLWSYLTHTINSPHSLFLQYLMHGVCVVLSFHVANWF